MLFSATTWIVRLTRETTPRTATSGDWSAHRQPGGQVVIVDLLVAGFLFLLSAPLIGPTAFVFFAGGLMVALRCAKSLECAGALGRPRPGGAGCGDRRTDLLYRICLPAYGPPGSRRSARMRAHRIVTTHLAPFGGAFFLAATAYSLRARCGRRTLDNRRTVACRQCVSAAGEQYRLSEWLGVGAAACSTSVQRHTMLVEAYGDGDSVADPREPNSFQFLK